MPILKSQLGNKKLESIIEDERVEYCTFENEEYSNNLYDNEFEHCEFDNIILQSITIEKVTFRNVKFTQCNFSNTVFNECTFIKCEFYNCKITGCNFIENILYNVTFQDVNASYASLSMSSIDKCLFKDTLLKNGYFQETKTKSIYFNNVDLMQAQFLKTSLNKIDLSSCKIEGIAISIEDIKGAIIEPFQAVDLMYLIGVKVK